MRRNRDLPRDDKKNKQKNTDLIIFHQLQRGEVVRCVLQGSERSDYVATPHTFLVVSVNDMRINSYLETIWVGAPC